MNRQDSIYRWLGGNDWQHIDGGAKQVTVGESGVWHLNGNGNMWYRTGTYGDVDTAGYGVGYVRLLNIAGSFKHDFFKRDWHRCTLIENYYPYLPETKSLSSVQ